jgi:hypothetical protein
MGYADMERMFSYGQPAARLWSVGLEEHCADSDLAKRIAIRETLGEYVCIEEFHRALFGAVPVDVSVWRLTQQIYEGIFGKSTKLATLVPEESDILLAEILPLPLPQHDDWPEIYGKWWPGGARSYRAATLPRMADRLVAQVGQHRPSVVVLHGKTEHRAWIYRVLAPRSGWNKEVLGSGRYDSAELLNREGTLWVLTNNLVNNGWVTWGDQEIAHLVAVIKNSLRDCGRFHGR